MKGLERPWEALGGPGRPCEALRGPGRPWRPGKLCKRFRSPGCGGLVLGRFGRVGGLAGVEAALLKNQFFGPGARSALALI